MLLTDNSTQRFINLSKVGSRRFISVLEPFDEDEFQLPSEVELLSLEYAELGLDLGLEDF